MSRVAKGRQSGVAALQQASQNDSDIARIRLLLEALQAREEKRDEKLDAVDLRLDDLERRLEELSG